VWQCLGMICLHDRSMSGSGYSCIAWEDGSRSYSNDCFWAYSMTSSGADYCSLGLGWGSCAVVCIIKRYIIYAIYDSNLTNSFLRVQTISCHLSYNIL
jgi:hypothetical protein